MRVPLSWLGEYVDLDVGPERLADRLTLLGMEVKAIDRWGADWQGVVVGELIEVVRHPSAGRLAVTQVDVGDGQPVSIVCGATNIAPGQRVPVALPGAILPGGRRIERADRMGVASAGMLCSGDELGLTSDADGILILPSDTPIGRPLTDLFGDTVLDVDVKPNRGDALSLVGLAREVAATTGGPVRFPAHDVEEAGPPIETMLGVAVADRSLCSRFVGRVVRGLTVGPSPDAVQMRLRAAGIRPISNVVDASNYVMIELGKPTHAFDAAHVRGGRLIVRPAAPGERITTIDHVERRLHEDTLVVADEAGAQAIAGIIGGASSEASATTHDVIIESAVFDPVAIRRTAQRLGIRSEASVRFEKGQETRLARVGADRVAGLIMAWAGGTIATGRVDTAPVEPGPSVVRFRPDRIDRLLGTRLGGVGQAALLARIGISTTEPATERAVLVADGPDRIVVEPDDVAVLEATVPTWRRDIAIEADLAEEVARVAGYESIPAALPATEPPAFRPAPLEARDAVRRALSAAGLTEVVTYALISPERAAAVRWPGDPGPPPPGEAAAAGDPIHAVNPLSTAHSVLRQQLVASLLDVVDANLRQGRSDVAIFEVGKGYGRVGERPHEWWRLGFALTGSPSPEAWDRPRWPYDFDDAKGLVERLIEVLGLPAVAFAPATDGYPFHPGRTAVATAGPDLVGRVGECHPELLVALGVRADRVVVGELAIRGLAGGGVPPVRVEAIPRHPPVERDIALVVAEGLPIGRVTETIRGAGGHLLAGVRLFDVYRGAPLAPGEKSLAFRLTFQTDRNLTEPEVDDAVSVVVEAVEAAGARLRN